MQYDKERVQQLFSGPKTAEVVDELLRLNYGLLIKQLKKFYLLKDPDALSYGYEALYNAIMSYTPGKAAFSTYATVCIYNRLGSHVRSLNTQIHTNTSSYEQLVGENIKLIDMLESQGTVDEGVMSEAGVSHLHKVFDYCYAEVKNDLHRQIIGLWSESNFTMTHARIAEELGCTQAYVSQTIKRFRVSMKQIWEAG